LPAVSNVIYPHLTLRVFLSLPGRGLR